MNEIELVDWNRRGLIPGPGEQLADFQKRVQFCLGLKNQFFSEISVPQSLQYDNAQEKIEEAALLLVRNLYGISPDWVPLFFSNWKLAPWHGGAAWIFQIKEDAPLGALLQLRKALYKKRLYLGLYERDELMAHEFAHVGRMAFEEKKFEELLAYRSSQKSFSRYFGPIIQSAQESRLVIYLFATLFLMDAFFLFSGSLDAYLGTQVFKLVPLLLILFGLLRLKQRQSALKKAEEKLKELVPDANAVVYRLTDREIELFSKSSIENIRNYIRKEPSLRWQVIRLSYCSKLL